jgi:CDP-diacylglycerol---glycerol-3-phosphate 3-phosphatidyltransferase
MNLPNKLTLARIILVPFFLVMLLNPGIPFHYLWAGLLFGIAALTDHLDGMLARKNNQITTFGKFLDPLADKILVVSALVCFVQLGLASTWCVILIIAREFMVTSIRLVAVDSGVVIAANRWGKTKTVSQIVAVVVILLLQFIQELVALGRIPAFNIGGAPSAYAFTYIGGLFIYIATFFTVMSGVIYIVQNIGVINTTK